MPQLRTKWKAVTGRRRMLWGSRSSNALVVVGVLIVLEVLVFRSHFSGSNIPEFDFISAYNLEAYAWWHDGSFFAPTQWMPYMWGGYPSVSNLQNSSFYLPVGIVSSIVPFSLYASAVLSALHVGFGALGAYVFSRSVGLRPSASLTALIGWFFAIGFFSNAAHLDIMRAYAWVPWMLLVLSPFWRWQSWWAYPVGALILWQGILGIYPGMVVAAVYAIGVWVVANQVIYRPRVFRFLVPIVIVGIASAAMVMLRYLPALSARGTYPAEIPDTSFFGFSTLATFFYPLTSDTMGMFFLPVALFVLLPFLAWKAPIVKSLLSMLSFSILLALPFWPWHELIRDLPGMDLSRFRASDFKVFILFALCILAASAMDRLVARGDVRISANRSDAMSRSTQNPVFYRSSAFWRLAILAGLIGGAVFLGIWFSYIDRISVMFQLAILIFAAGLVAVHVCSPNKRSIRRLQAGFGILIVCSGLGYMDAISSAWSTDRANAEEAYLQGAVDSFIDQRDDDSPLQQRPGRVETPLVPEGSDSIDRFYGSAFYSGKDSFFGYVNLRGTESFEMVKVSAYLPGQLGLDARRFWTAPGVVLEAVGEQLPTQSTTDECVKSGACGPNLVSTATAYRNGHFEYHLETGDDIVVQLNEAHYPGWHATLCPVTGSASCVDGLPVRGAAGEITLTVPQGDWNLNLDYSLPHQRKSWFLFYAGVALVCASSLVVWWSGRIRRRQADPSDLWEI